MLDYPLEMPETPLVQIMFANVPLPLMYYQEAQVSIRCVLDGQEGWHVIDMCVDQFLPWFGNRILERTSRKFMAKKLTLTRTSEGYDGKAIEKTGNIFMHMSFTAKDLLEKLPQWEDDYLNKHRYLPSTLNKENPLLTLKQSRGKRKKLVIPTGFLMPKDPNITIGEIVVSSASNHSWTRLIPTGTTIRGLYIE